MIDLPDPIGLRSAWIRKKIMAIHSSNLKQRTQRCLVRFGLGFIVVTFLVGWTLAQDISNRPNANITSLSERIKEAKHAKLVFDKELGDYLLSLFTVDQQLSKELTAGGRAVRNVDRGAEPFSPSYTKRKSEPMPMKQRRFVKT